MFKKNLQKLGAWLNYNPPGSLTSKGWRLFKAEYKENAPIRYWIKHYVRMPIRHKTMHMYSAVSEYVRYRTYDKYHILDTGLSPGYYSVSQQILNVNFNLFKHFIEVEQAWSQYDHTEHRKWWHIFVPSGILFRNWSSAELGIKHLEWAASLDDPALPLNERCNHQAVAAREMMVLYTWWINRPGRKYPTILGYDNQQLGMLACIDDDFDKSAADYIEHNMVMDDIGILEKKWDEEDSEMLIRLIKIREALWT
jgi:hypothetical protein